jgi:hypothetical protein
MLNLHSTAVTPHPYILSDLQLVPPGLGRLRHGLAGKSQLRFFHRVVQVGTEVATAILLDRLRPLQGGIRMVAAGHAPAQGESLALYMHWSPTGGVSDMVLGQLAAWRACGFDVVFVTNAAPPPQDWDKAGQDTVLRVARDNVGRDFGAWRDALAIVLRDRPLPHELLLANDSVLGPLMPMAPVIAALRAGGGGLFGLTENRGGGPHLQSYALLARGGATVKDVAAHLATCQPSRSKWRLVQKGEIGLTRHMLARGHRVAALFGYDRITGSLGPDDLRSLGPRFAEPHALDRYPLNPTHHLWRVLIERFGFPFLKTELVRRNPGRLPGVDAWPELVDDPTRRLLDEHLGAI